MSINNKESTDLSKQNREKKTESQTRKCLTSPGSPLLELTLFDLILNWF